jgi:hypothetical protein
MRQRLVAQPTAGLEGVLIVMTPVVGRLGAECDCHRHLSHYGRTAAADQAAIGEQHVAPGASRLDRRIHAGSAGTDHKHISFGTH